jgi:hypothetical protein
MQQRFEEGLTVPSSFFECPELFCHLATEMRAFGDLSTERQMGMGIGQIPRSKIIEYGQIELCLSGDDLRRFYQVMHRVDCGYLDIVNESRSSRPDADKERDWASSQDVGDVKRVMRSIAKRKKLEAKKR